MYPELRKKFAANLEYSDNPHDTEKLGDPTDLQKRRQQINPIQQHHSNISLNTSVSSPAPELARTKAMLT